MSIVAAARLDRLPISKFHHRILWLIGLGMFFDTSDIYLAGAVLGALVKSGWSNVNLNATFISATFLGLVLGSWMSGFVGDHFGRKFSYQFNLLIYGLGSLACAFAPNMTFLTIMRGITGVGLGAEVVTGYATLSEFVPPSTRGKWQAYLALITNSGLAGAGVLGYLIIPNLGWRWMFVFVTVGALIVLYFRRVLPESPRWCEARGNHDKAEKIVRAIEEEIEKERGTALPPVEAQHPGTEKKEHMPYFSLFRSPLLRRTVLVSVMLICQTVGVYTIVNWLPTILIKQGISISKSLAFNAVASLGGPFGVFIGSLVVDRLGRKWTGAGLFFMFAVTSYIYGFQSQVAMLVVLGFVLFTFLYILNPICYALYPAELYPTEIRVRGSGTSVALARLANVITPYIIARLLTVSGPRPVFELLGLVSVLTALVVATIGIETKKRTLEQTSFVAAAR